MSAPVWRIVAMTLSTETLWLPSPCTPREPPPRARSPQLSGVMGHPRGQAAPCAVGRRRDAPPPRRVLLVDGHRINRDIVHDLVRRVSVHARILDQSIEYRLGAPPHLQAARQRALPRETAIDGSEHRADDRVEPRLDRLLAGNGRL